MQFKSWLDIDGDGGGESDYVILEVQVDGCKTARMTEGSRLLCILLMNSNPDRK